MIEGDKTNLQTVANTHWKAEKIMLVSDYLSDSIFLLHPGFLWNFFIWWYMMDIHQWKEWSFILTVPFSVFFCVRCWCSAEGNWLQATCCRECNIYILRKKVECQKLYRQQCNGWNDESRFNITKRFHLGVNFSPTVNKRDGSAKCVFDDSRVRERINRLIYD